MEKLFAALREKHQGFEVVDVRFLVARNEVDGRDAGRIDGALAKAVREAELVDIATAVL